MGRVAWHTNLYVMRILESPWSPVLRVVVLAPQAKYTDGKDYFHENTKVFYGDGGRRVINAGPEFLRRSKVLHSSSIAILFEKTVAQALNIIPTADTSDNLGFVLHALSLLTNNGLIGPEENCIYHGGFLGPWIPMNLDTRVIDEIGLETSGMSYADIWRASRLARHLRAMGMADNPTFIGLPAAARCLPRWTDLGGATLAFRSIPRASNDCDHSVKYDTEIMVIACGNLDEFPSLKELAESISKVDMSGWDATKADLRTIDSARSSGRAAAEVDLRSPPSDRRPLERHCPVPDIIVDNFFKSRQASERFLREHSGDSIPDIKSSLSQGSMSGAATNLPAINTRLLACAAQHLPPSATHTPRNSVVTAPHLTKSDPLIGALSTKPTVMPSPNPNSKPNIKPIYHQPPWLTALSNSPSPRHDSASSRTDPGASPSKPSKPSTSTPSTSTSSRSTLRAPNSARTVSSCSPRAQKSLPRSPRARATAMTPPPLSSRSSSGGADAGPQAGREGHREQRTDREGEAATGSDSLRVPPSPTVAQRMQQLDLCRERTQARALSPRASVGRLPRHGSRSVSEGDWGGDARDGRDAGASRDGSMTARSEGSRRLRQFQRQERKVAREKKKREGGGGGGGSGNNPLKAAGGSL